MEDTVRLKNALNNGGLGGGGGSLVPGQLLRAAIAPITIGTPTMNPVDILEETITRIEATIKSGQEALSKLELQVKEHKEFIDRQTEILEKFRHAIDLIENG